MVDYFDYTKKGQRLPKMKKYKRKIDRDRQTYDTRLKDARDHFLDVFFEDRHYGNDVTKKDLMAVVIIQNLEILDLIRKDKGGV